MSVEDKIMDFVEKHTAASFLAAAFMMGGGGYGFAQFINHFGTPLEEGDQKKIERCVPNETPPALHR